MGDNHNQVIHGIVNKMTIAYGKLNRIIKKNDRFSKEEIVEMVAVAKVELDKAFDIIEESKK